MKVEDAKLLKCLKQRPCSYKYLGKIFNAHRTTIWRAIERVKRIANVKTEFIDGEIYFSIPRLPKVPGTHVKRESSKKSRNLYNELIEKLDRIDKSTDYPEVSYTVDDEPESAVLYISDLHIGSILKEGDKIIYDSNVANKKISRMYTNTTKVMKMIKRFHKVNKFYIAFLGDIIENDIIYQNQKYDINKRPLEQVSEAVKAFVPFIRKYSRDYDFVDIYTVRGNHGRISEEAHEDDNWDNIFYMMLKIALKDRNNVKLTLGKNGWNNFAICNKKIGINHGENLHHQASTSAGEDKFLKQIVKRNLDELHVAHWHERKSEEILGKMVYWNGAVKPSGHYEEKLGVDSVPTQTLQTYHHELGCTGVFYINLKSEKTQKL